MTESPAAPGGAPDPLDATRRWVERAVIGLNLCPFAKAVYVKQQVRFVLSDASTPEALLEELAEELVLLRDTDPEQVDTTLIVHPDVLTDFLDYNDFLDNADAAVEALDLQGVIQVAVAFHHLAHGNLRGARSLLREGRARLATVPSDTLPALDLQALLAATAPWEERLGTGAPPAEPPPPLPLRRAGSL